MSIFVGRDSYPASFGASFGAAGLKGKASFGPAYLADFLLGTTAGVLPAGVVVSSGTLGGLVTDSTGKLTYKGNNLLTYSNTFSDASWSTTSSGVTSAQNAVDPFGNANSAWTITSAATLASLNRNGAVSGAANNIISLYMKAGTAPFGFFQINDHTNGAARVAYFNLSTGVVGTINQALGSPANTITNATITTAGNGWYLCSVTVTGDTGLSPIFGLSDADASRTVTTGRTLFVYNATHSAVTYETTPRAADQVITGAQAYYGPAWDYAPNDGVSGTYAANNLIPQSENLAAWGSFGSPATLASGVAGPAGGPATVFQTNSSGIYNGSGSFNLTAGVRYVFSFYAKASGAAVVTASIPVGVSSQLTGADPTFDLSAGTNTETGGAQVAITSLGNGWYRVSSSVVSTTTASSPNWFIKAPSGSVYVTGVQVEGVLTSQTTPSAYIATTSAPYYGAGNTALTWIGNPLGLRIWESRTNLVTYSAQFDNAAWGKANGTVITADSTTAPDGTNTADTWVSGATGAAAYPSIYQTVTGTSGVTQTASIYAKAGNSNTIDIEVRGASGSVHDFTFTLTGGGTAAINPSAVGSPTATITAVGNGWYRCTVTKTSTSTSFLVIIGQETSTAGNTVYLWGAQLEQAATASPYIPTGASAVTAAADDVTLGGVPATIIGLSAMSLILETGQIQNPFVNPVLVRGANNATPLQVNGNGHVASWNNSSTLSTTLGSGDYSGVVRSAFATSAAGRSLVANGGTVGSDANTDGAPTSPVNLGGNASYIDGYVRKLALYNTRLPDFALQSRSVIGTSLTS